MNERCPKCYSGLSRLISEDGSAWEADVCSNCGLRWFHDPPKTPPYVEPELLSLGSCPCGVRPSDHPEGGVTRAHLRDIRERRLRDLIHVVGSISDQVANDGLAPKKAMRRIRELLRENGTDYVHDAVWCPECRQRDQHHVTCSFAAAPRKK